MDLIKIFEATDTDFTSNNGIKSLQPTKCIVHQQENGEYYADIECSVKYDKWMKQHNIVVIKGQGFRLNNPTIKNSKMSFRAYHVSYDAQKYIIQDIQVDNYNVSSIASLINTHIYPTQTIFTISSNITTTIASCKYVYQSLFDCIMSLVDVSEGYLVRDNWTISIIAKPTIDHQRVIAMGKNIITYQSKEKWDDVVTTLIAISSDGSMLDEKMIVSQTQYDIPYVKAITFYPRDGVDTNNPSDVKEDLSEQANAYIDVHQYPDVSYTIEADSTLGDVVVGETIQLKHPKIDKYLTTTVYAIEYNALIGKVTKITFGTFCDNLRSTLKANITDKFISMYRDLEKVDNENKSRFSVASDAITAEVERASDAEGSLSTALQLTANGLSSKVEKNAVISEINQSAEQVKISANKINLEGLTTINNKFKVHLDGSMECDQGIIKNSAFQTMKYQFDDENVYELFHDGFYNSIHMLTPNTILWMDGNFVISYENLTILGTEGGYVSLSLTGHKHNSLDITPDLTNSGNIDFSGDVNGASVTYVQNNFQRVTSSDQRLKYNIMPLKDIKDTYMNLKPKKYKFKDGCSDDKEHYGLLAQEVEKLVSPDSSIIERYDIRSYMNEGQYVPDRKAYRINYNELHAYHIAMIQQQQKQIEELEREIKSIREKKGKIINIKAFLNALKKRIVKKHERGEVI